MVLILSNLKEELDRIDSEVLEYAKDRYYESRLKIEIAMWEKGEVIYTFTGGKSINYSELERQTGRDDQHLKRWYEIYSKCTNKDEYIEKYAKPKALKWTQKALRKLTEDKDRGDARANAGSLPDGVFNVIYADPPWEYSNTGFDMSASQHYSTMPTETICELKDKNGKEILECIADNCICFLWVTNPLLEDGLRVMSEWGFDYKTCMVWVKKNHTAGFYVYGKHELLLIGVRGSMLPEGEKYKSIIEGDNSIHSKKPDCVYDMIEKMYPDCRYLEIFARQKYSKKWEVFGNEI